MGSIGAASGCPIIKEGLAKTMITFEAVMNELDKPTVAGLTTSALNQDDIINLILQRSEIISDQERFNRYIRSWIQGDVGPMLDLIDRLGADVLARRAAAYIYLEYQKLRPIFDAKPPKVAADIGCGYAMFDMFLAQDYDCELHLIDIESNEHRHFGFEEEGAAYSSLAGAETLLKDNGIAPHRISTLNPSVDDVNKLENIDYAFSFISCGYHYPWHTYRSFFQNSVQQTGRIIIDIRGKTFGGTVRELSEIGYVRALDKAAKGSADRVMIAKVGGV